MKVSGKLNGSTLRLCFSGPLDELCDEIAKKLKVPPGVTAIVLDLDGVGSVNSYGAKLWSQFMEGLRGDIPVTIERCRPAFATLASLISSVTAGAKIGSVYVPFACPACEAHDDVLIDFAKGTDLGDVSALCRICKIALEPDVDGEEYLEFMVNKRP